MNETPVKQVQRIRVAQKVRTKDMAEAEPLDTITMAAGCIWIELVFTDGTRARINNVVGLETRFWHDEGSTPVLSFANVPVETVFVDRGIEVGG